MLNFLKPVGASATTGAKYSPFFLKLSDDGTDTTLAEDYSSAATDLYVQLAGDALIHSIAMCTAIDAPSQSLAYGSTFYGATALTNGLKFGVKNAAGTVIQDLTVSTPLYRACDLLLFSSNASLILELPSGTAANNELIFSMELNLVDKFGAPLFVAGGDRFVCTVQDNLATLSEFSIAISGYYA